MVNLALGNGWLGGLAIYVFGQNLYTREHAALLSLVQEPFSIAMSNALKYREVQTLSDNIAKENQGLFFLMRLESCP